MQITFLELKSRQLTFCLSTAPEGEVWSVCGGGGLALPLTPLTPLGWLSFFLTCINNG